MEILIEHNPKGIHRRDARIEELRNTLPRQVIRVENTHPLLHVSFGGAVQVRSGTCSMIRLQNDDGRLRRTLQDLIDGLLDSSRNENGLLPVAPT